MDNTNNFDGQRPNETVVGLFRRTPLSFLRHIILASLSLVLGSALVIKYLYSDVLFIGIALFVASCLVIITKFISWYYSIYIVTNQRIRFVDQKGIFRKAMVDIELSEINSATCQVPGVYGEVFKFGHVTIDSNAGELIIHHIYQPEKLYNLIQNQISAMKGYKL